MTNLPDSLVRFYDDGPDWPRTPERQDAERACGVVLLNCEDDPGDTIAPRLDKAGVDDNQIAQRESVCVCV